MGKARRFPPAIRLVTDDRSSGGLVSILTHRSPWGQMSVRAVADLLTKTGYATAGTYHGDDIHPHLVIGVPTARLPGRLSDNQGVEPQQGHVTAV